MNAPHENRPPRLAEVILGWLLKDDWQTPLGDFEEYYNDLTRKRGRLRARWWYRGQVIQLLPNRLYEKAYWSSIMLKNYLVIAFRNLYKHPFFAGLNILGLAVGIASCLLILLYVSGEQSYDKQHEKADQIYRLNWDYNWNESEGIGPGTPPPLAKTMMEEVPEIDVATRIYRASEMVVSYEDVFFNETSIFAADPNFFEVFSFPLLEGDPATALNEPGNVILTQETAQKYFGKSPALGQTIQIGESQESWFNQGSTGPFYSSTFKVAGILKDLPANSHLDFDLLTSMSSHPIVEYFDWSWVWMQVTTYALVADPALISGLEAKVAGLVENHAPAAFAKIGFSYEELMQNGGRWDFVFQPLSDIYLGSQRIGNRLGPIGNKTYLYILMVVALFILIIACINFMNLSTARSASRAKEVGVRKVLGSERKNLIGQFMMEAMLLTFFAMVVAVCLAAVCLYPFSQFVGMHLGTMPFSWGRLLMLLLAMTVVIGLLAGSYPSLYLSRFTPITTLNRLAGKEGRFFRNGLVVFQFAISIALIVCTLLVNKQMRFVEQVDMGFDKEGLLVISNQNDRLGNSAGTFKEVIKNNANISGAAQTTGVPFSSGFQDYYKVENRGDEQFDLTSYLVDDEFMATLGLEIVAGRGFSKDFPSSLDGIVLNESAIKRFGLEDPIGKTITYPSAGTYTVIGVVKDFNFMSLHESIMPFALFHQDSESYQTSNSHIVVRLQLDELQQTLYSIEEAWHAVAPGTPFEYSFLDESMAAQYRSEKQLESIFFIFSALAIIIACLGLVGLAAYAAEKRTREIGIRKTLGATIPGLFALLVKDFIKWVIAANILAWPLAWIGMNWWLGGFAYRVEIGYAAFILAAILAFMIAIVTVGYHTSKVALSNPITSLRYE